METVSIYEHAQIGTSVTCACGRGWVVKGIVPSSWIFRQKVKAEGWSIAASDNELFIPPDGIQCPVCNGRMTEEEYKASGL